MPIEKISPPELHVPDKNLYTHIVRATGNVMYRIGGQVALNRAGENVFIGDMAGQLRFCYEQVTIALNAVGLSWKDVVHIYTFTTDMDAYMEAEPPIAKSFFGEDPPASTLVEVSRLVERDWLVEIQVDAIADQ